MVKPFKVFLILLSILAILAILSFFVPPNGLTVGDYHLRYPSLLKLFDLDSAERSTEFSLHPELTLLDQVLDSISRDREFDSGLLWVNHTEGFEVDTVVENQVDTLHVDEQQSDRDTELSAEILKNILVAIEMPDSNFTALKPFFEALATGQSAKKQIRVLHYGDSQIEGDRITSFLRSRLQTRFGGRGVGLLHAVPHSYQPGGVFQTISSNWNQTLLADLGKGAIEHRFGILGGYSSFSSSRKDSRGGFTEAWIRMQRRGSSQSSARNFTRCRVFYGEVNEPFLISLSYAGKTQDAEMIPPTKALSQITWSVPLSQKDIQVDFKGDESPLIYGISLESTVGVLVDNIAIRGSSGNDFTRADAQSLKRAMQMVDAKLIILQFGVNIVPNIVKSYKYYENQMYQQVVALKRAKPDAAILLIGVSDMSRREDGSYVSYPNVEKIRDAQRNAALRSGAAFWDCYKAMGGANSMPAWTFANPPLASKDFVHFTLRGSNLIAEMFYSSLMEAYEQYQQTLDVNIVKSE
jgi:lysophospholipase L1-like esterase